MSTQPTERPPQWARQAAIGLYPHGVATYCYSTAEKNEEAKQRDWDEVAAIIAKYAPRESANARLVRMLRNVLEAARSIEITAEEAAQVFTDGDAALATTEAQPEIGEVLDALAQIIAECPNPKLPYGVRVVEIASTVLQKFGRGK